MEVWRCVCGCEGVLGGPWIMNTNISAWSRYVRRFMTRDSIPALRLLYTAGTAMQLAHTFRRSAYVT